MKPSICVGGAGAKLLARCSISIPVVGAEKGGSVTTAKESPSSCSQRLLSDEQIQMCSTHPPPNSKRNIQEPRKDCCTI